MLFLFLSIPILGATVCQISSVINGISGCDNLKIDSRTTIKVFLVSETISFLNYLYSKIGFVSSRYQSQYSFQIKS